MNILYLDCHSILAFDEIKLFTEMGHNVFSLGGSYFNPNSPADPKRPSITVPVPQQLMDIANQCSKDNIHPDLIEWADIIYIMHRDDWIINNWSKIKEKIVIWRTIGQSVPQVENKLAFCRTEGLRVVRYSPMEENIKGQIGSDVTIRFYKDPEEFGGWTGDDVSVINVAQSLKKRGLFCGYDIFTQVTDLLPRYVYGPGNEDIPCWAGELPYIDLQKAYKKHRVYFYTGTYPASYTLNFIEALMTGIPVVAIGEALSNIGVYDIHAYEVDKIIKNGINGFISDDLHELRGYVEDLLKDKDLAKRIGDEGRKTAIELFGKETIKAQWKEFFDGI